MALHIDLPPDSHGVLNTSQLFCMHGVVTFSLKAHLRRQLFQNGSFLCLRLSNFSKLSCGMHLCLSEHIVFHLLYSPHVLEEKVHQNKNILHLTPMMLQGLTRGYATGCSHICSLRDYFSCTGVTKNVSMKLLTFEKFMASVSFYSSFQISILLCVCEGKYCGCSFDNRT